jgi:hypothetical protein
MLTDVQGGYLHERYDTLIIDPPTTADVKLYDAIHDVITNRPLRTQREGLQERRRT